MLLCRRLRSHLRAHVDLFLELNLLHSTNVDNNAIQRAAPSSPPKNAILFVVSPAKTYVYSSKFLASCIHKLEFIQVFLNGDLDAKLVSCIPSFIREFSLLKRFEI